VAALTESLEVHWYDAHGLGRKLLKIKRIVRELR